METKTEKQTVSKKETKPVEAKKVGAKIATAKTKPTNKTRAQLENKKEVTKELTPENKKLTPTKSYMATPENVTREWLVVDAEGQPVGRVAARVALILRGKHKPTYTPHTDAGDFVIIINSDKAILTGKKMEKKYYFRHTGYIGGDKFVQAKEMMAKNSDRAMEHAIKGMLPKTPLGRDMFGKLKVYKGAEHPHQAQMPRKIELNGGDK